MNAQTSTQAPALTRLHPRPPAPPNLKLTELRQNRGWSPEQLGYYAGGMSGKAVRDIESGKTRQPRAGTKLALAQALQVSITDIWPLRERTLA